MMTDNQGLLTRVGSSLRYPEPFPNVTLGPDWDVLNKIAKSLQTLTTAPRLLHVKGHQDSKMPYHQLPLNAPLNADADKEAGYFQCMHPAQRPLVPHISSNHVQLNLSGQVICSKLKQKIREAFVGSP
jgi:hypothetical protein